jgi:hypothetical protein
MPAGSMAAQSRKARPATGGVWCVLCGNEARSFATTRAGRALEPLAAGSRRPTPYRLTRRAANCSPRPMLSSGVKAWGKRQRGFHFRRANSAARSRIPSRGGDSQPTIGDACRLEFAVGEGVCTLATLPQDLPAVPSLPAATGVPRAACGSIPFCEPSCYPAAVSVLPAQAPRTFCGSGRQPSGSRGCERQMLWRAVLWRYRMVSVRGYVLKDVPASD